jgi:hypothetical protein
VNTIAKKPYSSLKPQLMHDAPKSKRRTLWLTPSARASVQTDLNVAAVEEEQEGDTVAVIAGDAAETLTEEFHDANVIQGPHHRTWSASTRTGKMADM